MVVDGMCRPSVCDRMQHTQGDGERIINRA